MAFDPARVKTLFLNASDLAYPEERAAYLDRECGGEPRSAAGSRRCSRPRTGPARPRSRGHRRVPSDPAETLEATRESAPETLSGSMGSGPGPGLATVGATGGRGAGGTLAEVPSVARTGGFVPGRVIAGRYTLLEVLGEGGMGTVYRAEQSQPVKRQVALKLIRIGMDSRDRPGAVRRRTPGAGDDGPPQHRPRLRRRRHRGQPAVLRDGARPWRADHRLLRPAPPAGRGPARVVRRGLPGGPARPPEGDHPPRHQALERDGHRGRRPAHAQGDRLRRGQGDRVQPDRPEPGRHRRHRRHADVHVARAGRPVDSGHRHPHGRLRPGRDPLRAAGRLAAAGRDAVQAGASAGDAADGAGGRPSEAEHQGQHVRRLAQHRGQSRDRPGATEARAARGSRLDRDEGAGEGSAPDVTRRPTASGPTSCVIWPRSPCWPRRRAGLIGCGSSSASTGWG